VHTRTTKTPSHKRGGFLLLVAGSPLHLLLLLNTAVHSEPIDWIREPPVHEFYQFNVMEES